MSYIRYSNLAPNFKSTLNPFLISLISTPDKSFLIGDTGYDYGPKFKNCQLVIAQYIAGTHEWDSLCEYASSIDEGKYPILFNPTGANLTTQELHMCHGDIFLYIAAYMKYARFVGGRFISYPFNPHDPDSLFVSELVSDGVQKNCKAIFDGLDLSVIDNDILMDKLIEKPIVFFRILMSIYHTYRIMNIDLATSNTKLGRFFYLNKHIFCEANYIDRLNTIRLTR
jgi:hypothetical protein